MRGRIIGVLLTALVLAGVAVVPASAGIAWRVEPGGDAVATADEVVIGFGSTDVRCGPVEMPMVFEPDANLLAVVPVHPGTAFNLCGIGGLTPAGLVQLGTWTLVGLSHDAGLTVGRLDDVSLQLSAPGCEATISGYVIALYTNETGVLSLLGDETLTVSSVSPVDDCLGLVHVGDTGSVAGEFVVSPRQIITP